VALPRPGAAALRRTRADRRRSARLCLTAEESAALAAALAPTFASLGRIEVLARHVEPAPVRRRAGFQQALQEAAGRAAAPLARRTPPCAPWRQAINEAQILLHAHPLNKAREAAGQAVVNSLWPWGGGRLPAHPRQPP
jgi:hypothetical protein